MAKAQSGAKGMVTAIGHIVLGIMALNFLGLAALVGGQLAMGNLDKRDLLDVLFVLKGSKRYTMNVAEIEEYQKLKQQEVERRAKLDQEKGRGPARPLSAQAFETRQQIQEENYRTLKEQLAEEQRRLAQSRDEIEKAKKDLAAERAKLEEYRRQQLKVAQSENMAKMQKTLANMDPADIAGYFQNLLKTRGGNYEAARYLRDLVKPDLAAEILTESKPEVRQQILPLVENEYADLSAKQVVERLESEGRLPDEIAEVMWKMPAMQAFDVYFTLESKVRAQVARILQQ